MCRSSGTLALGSPRQRDENDLPSDVHDTPELCVTHAERTHIAPEPVDDLHVCHEPAEPALGAGMSRSAARERVPEAEEAVAREVADIRTRVGGGRGRRGVRRREVRGERGQERGEQRVRAARVQVRVEEVERLRARDSERDEREADRGTAALAGGARELREQRAVCGEDKRVCGEEGDCARRGVGGEERRGGGRVGLGGGRFGGGDGEHVRRERAGWGRRGGADRHVDCGWQVRLRERRGVRKQG